MAFNNHITTYWRRGDPLVLAGQFAQALRPLLLLALALLLPRLGVGAQEIGQWEQLQYLSYLLSTAWLTGLAQAYLPRAKAGGQPLANALLRLGVGLSVVVVMAAWWGKEVLQASLIGGQALPGWGWMLVFLLGHWPGLLYEQRLLAQGRVTRLIVFALLSNFALAFALVLPLILGYGWSVSVSSLALVGLFKIGLLFDGRAWDVGPTAPAALLLRPALSLAGYAAMGALTLSFAAWFVNFWYGGQADTFAVFRYGTRELPFVLAFTNGIGQATLSRLGSADPAAGLAALKQSGQRLMHFVFPLALLLLVASPWWWEPLFTDQFAAALPLFQVYLLVLVPRLFFPVVVLTATGHGKALLLLGGAELLLAIVLSYWWIVPYGMLGVVWAVVVAAFSDKLLAALYLYHRERIAPSAYCSLNGLLGYSSLLLLAGWALGVFGR
ncbi:MAG: hypothetical protein HC821_03925 [Lewinella sp.]|nr:hypothetical protein [Lewinella sp.]